MENLLYTLWLHLLPGIGPYLIRKLITTFGSATTIYTAPFDALLKVPGIGTKLAQTITSSKNTSQANSLLEYCLTENIQLVFYQDPLYPQCLLNFPKSPTLLYVKGNLTPFNTHSSAAIVETGAVVSLFPPFTTVHKQNLKASITQPKCSHNHSAPLAKDLCSLITHEGLTLDTLSQKLHLDLSSLHELIFQLELEGTIY